MASIELVPCKLILPAPSNAPIIDSNDSAISARDLELDGRQTNGRPATSVALAIRSSLSHQLTSRHSPARIQGMPSVKWENKRLTSDPLPLANS